MASPLFPVVLCGGSGSRLWPMSRRLLPKQFLPLVTERSLLQDAIERCGALAGAKAPVVVSNNEHRFLVAEQLQEIAVRPSVQILEPVGRNTAPAVAVAALWAVQQDPAASLLVMPSDHAITDVRAFAARAAEAHALSDAGMIVTFGVTPSHPATGYGYIERGAPIDAGRKTFAVRRFVEKPDARTATEYLASGQFLWNSGMFVFRAQRFLDELGRLRPDILAGAGKAFQASTRDLDFLRLDAKAFEACPADSVDYAVMEKAGDGAVVEIDIGWSDVGSWSALWDIAPKDGAGNVSRGDVELRDVSRSYVRADSRFVYVLGLEDVLVVETDDAVLVGSKERAQDVKEIVEHLDRGKRSEHVSHTRVYRPWGYYESVDSGPWFQVKRIMVKPGQALSLQKHHKRAEHWIVVSGTARVTRGKEVFDLQRNESTYIPLGEVHRLQNPAAEPLLIIEVQSGSYLGEDDIVRIEDRYNRA